MNEKTVNEEIIIKTMPLSFYKAGGIYTGNIGAMRYMVKKEASDESERLAVYIWPGPFIFEATKDELKSSHSFEVSEEGIEEATQWISKAYTENREKYSGNTSLLENNDRLKPELGIS